MSWTLSATMSSTAPVHNPQFSKRKQNFSWLVQQHMDQFHDRLLRECKDTGELITLNNAWGVVTTAIVNH